MVNSASKSSVFDAGKSKQLVYSVDFNQMSLGDAIVPGNGWEAAGNGIPQYQPEDFQIVKNQHHDSNYLEVSINGDNGKIFPAARFLTNVNLNADFMKA